jgi:DNA repair protein SbcC/Rad50
VRPLRLEMTAFGPYAGTQVLDFRELKDSTFFLITGPTGAGKTSVLDAVCFALYGDTTGHERKGSHMRSQFASPETETRVRLDFSIGEETYRIDRAPQQERPARNRSGQLVLQPASATLVRRTGVASDSTGGEVLASRWSDATECVQKLLGFSVEQFRQVVMLPQGRFRDLLSADSKTRQGILEQLFNASLYGELEEFLKERKKKLLSSLEESRSRIAELLSVLGVSGSEHLDERLIAAAEQAEEAERAVALARSAVEAAETALRSGTEKARLLAEADIAQRDCVLALERLTRARSEAAEAAAVLSAERARDGEREALAEQARLLDSLVQKAAELEETERRTAAAQQSEFELREGVTAAVERLSDAQEETRLAAGRLLEVRNISARVPVAEAVLRDAERVVVAVERLQGARKAAEEAASGETVRTAAVEAAASALRVAREDAEQMDRLWRAGRAAALAADLTSGDPCPVCGSTTHPSPASAEAETPSDELLENARAHVEDLTETLRVEEARYSWWLASSVECVATLREVERTLGPEVGVEPGEAAGNASRANAVLHEVRRMAAELPECERRLGTAQGAEDAARTALDGARRQLGEAEQARSHSAGVLAEKLAAMPEEYRDRGALRAARLMVAEKRAAAALALEEAGAADKAAVEALAAAQGEERSARRRADAACAGVGGGEPPDLGALADQASAAATARDEAVYTLGQRAEEVTRLRGGRRRLSELARHAEDTEERYRLVALLADVASGGNARSVSFQRYVLAVFLDEVLAAASRHLLSMTASRFRLHAAGGTEDRRRAGGLDLEVFDEYTGEDRAVCTLSGGEGFLASLSMALGLAEVVQNVTGGIRLEAVFIDEGFGTLDPVALDSAVDTLLSLREHGRLVGVISHVPELRDRIDCRLEVAPGRRGSTACFVVP